MWFAWDMDGLIVHGDTKLNDTIVYNTKSEALWDIGCRYADGRKRLKVSRIDRGYYAYSPRDCDGNYGSDTTIVSTEYMKLNEYARKEFNEHLGSLYQQIMDEIYIIEGTPDIVEETDVYYAKLIHFKTEVLELINKYKIPSN